MEEKQITKEEMLKNQIQSIKSLAKEVDESQGIVGSAMAHLISVQVAQGIAQSLSVLNQQLNEIIEILKKEKPLIHVS
jgi:NifB/MoaA-like Fe-S oxidoreductase